MLNRDDLVKVLVGLSTDLELAGKRGRSNEDVELINYADKLFGIALAIHDSDSSNLE